jgi:hypothetical protein
MTHQDRKPGERQGRGGLKSSIAVSASRSSQPSAPPPADAFTVSEAEAEAVLLVFWVLVSAPLGIVFV